MQKFLYRLKNNKVALFIIFLSLSIVYLVYSDFKSNNINAEISKETSKNPHLLVTKGNAIIKRASIIKLGEKEKSDLLVGDKIRTFNDSNATIFWSDGSITRLGEKTAITIKQMDFSKRVSGTKIKFDLSEGKTWSNIIKFLSKDSFFTETYDNGNYAATVRGTVFEVNLENNYAHAVNHNISITDTQKNEIYNVPEGGARSLFNPKNSVPDDVWDNDWISKNLIEDKTFLEELQKQWKHKLDAFIKAQTPGMKTIGYLKSKVGVKSDYIIQDISRGMSSGDIGGLDEIKDIIPNLSEKDRYILNAKLKGYYQNIHSLPNTENMAIYKSSIRSMILDTSEQEEKSNLQKDFTRLDIFDYVDVSKDKTSKISGILKDNINAYLSKMTDEEDVASLFGAFSDEMLSIIGIDFGQVNKEVSIIIEKLKDEDFRATLSQKILKGAESINNSISGKK